MPDVRIPDTLLSHAYGLAIIPDVTKVAFIFGLSVRRAGILAAQTIMGRFAIGIVAGDETYRLKQLPAACRNAF